MTKRCAAGQHSDGCCEIRVTRRRKLDAFELMSAKHIRRWIVCTLGLGGAASYWLLSPRQEKGPTPFTYAPLNVQSAILTPQKEANLFSMHGMPLHRVLTLRSTGILAFPLAAQLANADMRDVRSRLCVYSYCVKEPNIQVERSYTPLSALSRTDPSIVQLLVKRYRDGEVSRYLHRVRQGSTVSLRGPEITWQLPESAPVPDHIIMVCRKLLTQLVAGTGVTTAHQLLSNVLDNKPLAPNTPEISVIYAAPSMDALQLVPELSDYQRRHPDRVSVHVFVEDIPPRMAATLSNRQGEEVPASLHSPVEPRRRLFPWLSTPSRESWTLSMPSYSIPLTLGRVDVCDVAVCSPDPHIRRLFLVCGPEGFVQAMAGSKGRDLVSQGPLGGVLAKLGYQSTDVFKM